MIQIKVGHKIFSTSEATLKKSEYFSSLLTRWDKETIELDEDPRIFGHFLNVLRHDEYHIPEKYRDNVFVLCKYYGVDFDIVEKKSYMVLKHYIHHGNSGHFDRADINQSIYLFCKAFNGKLKNVTWHTMDTIRLTITFNGKQIFYKSNIHNNDSEWNFFIKWIDNFEGDFIVEAYTSGNFCAVDYYEQQNL